MIEGYLKDYNYDERRFISWVKSQGYNPNDAIILVAKYSKDGKSFDSGNALCHQLIQDLHNIDIERTFADLTCRVDIKKEISISVDTRSKMKKIWDLIRER